MWGAFVWRGGWGVGGLVGCGGGVGGEGGCARCQAPVRAARPLGHCSPSPLPISSPHPLPPPLTPLPPPPFHPPTLLPTPITPCSQLPSGYGLRYICSAGSYSRTGAKTCTPCPVNYYQPKAAQTTCLPCTAGSTRGKTGATACSVTTKPLLG